MEQYRQERERQQRNSRLAGAGLTIVASLYIGCSLAWDGLPYTYPPPPEQSPITLDFTEEPPQKIKPKQQWNGTRPTVQNPDPERDVKLVQQSQSPIKGTKENLAKEATVDEHGDVETPAPKRDTIKQTALFPGSLNQSEVDATSPHASFEPNENVEDGHIDGNIKEGDQAGKPNARLAGRTVIGALPLPVYNIQESGKVVVKIKVNRDGTVVEAQPGEAGTTLTNKTAWEAAKKVALKAQFNMKSDAPEYQYGTITYIFNITK
jgi:hypothetical protein